jgi:hypothetical protein
MQPFCCSIVFIGSFEILNAELLSRAIKRLRNAPRPAHFNFAAGKEN